MTRALGFLVALLLLLALPGVGWGQVWPGGSPIATTTQPGLVQPDGTTIGIVNGVASVIAPSRYSAALLYGTGTDNNVTISSGTTTLTRDMHYANLTISGTGALKPNGYFVFVTGTLDISGAAPGAISSNGSNAGNAAGAAAGLGGFQAYSGTPVSLPSIAGFGGPNGGTGNTTTGINPSAAQSGANTGNGGLATAGGSGGNGVSAGASGGATTTTFIWGAAYFNTPTTVFQKNVGGNNLSYQTFIGGVYGGAGGQGGGDGTNAGGGGGGGGGATGWIAIYARFIQRGTNSNAAIVQNKGGNGGNGANGVAGNAGAGGAGSGAGGGMVYIVTESLLGSAIANAIDVSGGTGGNGGNGSGTGKGGNGGSGGNSGNVQIINLSAPSFTVSSFNAAGTAGGTTATATGAVGGAGATLQVGL